MELQVQKREKFGRAVKSLRSAGFIPGELYGHGLQNIHVSVPRSEFTKVLKSAGENTVINLVVDGKKHPVLINDVHKNHLTNEILNIDFYQVRMDEKLRTKVPVHFIGEAPAVKSGGILIKVMQEIEVEALPANLPKFIEVNLGGLDAIGKSFLVSDLASIEGVRLIADPSSVIAIAKEVEEEKAPEVAPAAATAEAAAAQPAPEAAPKEAK